MVRLKSKEGLKRQKESKVVEVCQNMLKTKVAKLLKISLLYEQNRKLLAQNQSLIYKLDRQSEQIKEQSQQIDKLLHIQNQQAIEKQLKDEAKAKRKTASKKPPRDVNSPAEVEQTLQEIRGNKLKTHRLKVAIILLFLTGRPVSNLFFFNINVSGSNIPVSNDVSNLL